jgi:glucose/arabinose dehydrogenase
MKPLVAVVLSLLAAPLADAAALPGFRAELLGSAKGFVTSLVVDTKGTIHYTTLQGSIYRFEGGESVELARVQTDPVGNSGLLGMALIDDTTAVVHYTTPNQTHDVVSRIDLVTGAENIIHRFVADQDFPERGSSSEHHGGNPIVAEDGSIFVSIGDYGGGLVASLPESNGGKIFRIFPDGSVMQFARGLRNPFDIAWDAASQRLIVPDNGPIKGDEIHLVSFGDHCGWPWTSGHDAAVTGTVAPEYVFPDTIAPTGLVRLNSRNDALPSGYLLAAFVSGAIYLIRDIDVRPFPDPLPIIRGETGPIIDVTQALTGEIYFATGSAIYRLEPPFVRRTRAVRH